MTCIFSPAKKQFSQLLLAAIPATLQHAGVITIEANEFVTMIQQYIYQKLSPKKCVLILYYISKRGQIHVTGCPEPHIIGNVMYEVLKKDNASDNILKFKNGEYQMQHVYI
jgi:hypothetical protein